MSDFRSWSLTRWYIANMTRRKRLLLLGGVALAIAHVAVLVVPAWRWAVLGLLRHESFYDGRPTSYWRAEILKWENPLECDPSWVAKLAARLLPWTEAMPPLFDNDAAANAVLIELLRDRDATVRKFAVVSLRKTVRGDKTALAALVAALDDADGIVVDLVRVTIEENEDPSLIPPLTNLLQHPNPNVRCEAAWRLGKFGVQAKSALPALTKLLGDDSKTSWGFPVRQHAKCALEEIRAEDNNDILVEPDRQAFPCSGPWPGRSGRLRIGW